MNIRSQVITTALVSVVFLLVNALLKSFITMQMAKVAGVQMQNSDDLYIANSFVTFLSFSSAVLPFIFLGIFIYIWYDTVKTGLKKLGPPTLGFLLIFMPTHSKAYFETTEKTEAYTILPNETAFWIPDTGANKDSQAQLDSEAYLQERKIAVKRYVIPHAKLTNTGGFLGWDYYVPTGRLIILSRAPFSREWVAHPDRGTSNKNESIPCQSKEGLDVAVGVSVGASVSEANAAKFLYRFGVLSPQGNRNDPQVIFTSVYYGRNLGDVMDDNGRKKIQTLVCNEITQRTLDEVNADAKIIQETVTTAATAYFASVGITLDFLGWADTFTFHPDVQAAINRRFVAAKDQEIAVLLSPYTDVIQSLAASSAMRSFGDKTDGRFPSTMVGQPTSLESMLGALLRQQPVQKPAAK